MTTITPSAPPPPPKDPLTLDLDHDGIETVALSANILFDHDGDGIKTGTGWINADDGLLVFDRNGNGTIDNGTELFGDSTALYSGPAYNPNGTAKDGFAALVQEDTNQDGKVNAADAHWNQLRVWRDLNQDGVSQTEELFTLEQLGIASFDTVKTTNIETLANGNQIADLGTYVKTDGSIGTLGEISRIADVNLIEDTFYREFPDTIPLAEGVLDLPDMQGSGKVRDLHEAASQSAQLKNLLTQFSQATTHDAQVALLDQLLAAWADTSGLVKTLQERAGDAVIVSYQGFGDTSIGDYMLGSGLNTLDSEKWNPIVSAWEQKLHVLEAFNGRYFFRLSSDEPQGPSASTGMSFTGGGGGGGGIAAKPQITILFTQEQIDFLDQSYGALRESVYGALITQTRIRPLFDEIDVVMDTEGVKLDFSSLEQHFQDQMATNGLVGLGELIEFNRFAGSMIKEFGWHGDEMIANAIHNLPITAEVLSFYVEFGSSLYLQKDGTSGEDVLLSSYANDRLRGNEGDDVLSSGNGEDILYGGTGNDTLIGGAGNDSMMGDAGSDLYIFTKGAGQDTISNYDISIGKTDTLLLTGILTSEVKLNRAGNDLVMSMNGATDRITLSNYLQNDGANDYTVEQIRFDDGTTWDVATVKGMLLTGTPNADSLVGYASNDAINGGAGADYLFGHAGNDVLNGDDGNDALYGGTGHDTLTGGMGNDSLMGDAGSDTYIFSKGSGQDIISNYDISTGKTDTLLLTGILPSEVRLTRTGNDLVISINGTSDKVTLVSYLQNDGTNDYRLEQIRFDDGTTWDMAAVAARLLAGTPGNDSIYGTAYDDLVNAGAGTDYLYGYAGNDILNGENGNDIVYAGAGNDTLTGGAGNDTLMGDAGNDTYIFGKGAGQDFISNYDASAGKTDTLLLSGVLPGEVNLSRTGNDVVVSMNGTTDKVTLSYYLQNDGINDYKIEQIKFDDGTAWDVAMVKAKLLIGTSNNDSLFGYASDDAINGGAGADYLYGYAGNDVLNGEDGNDIVYAGVGNDTLTGGAGNDTLMGDAGSDTYIFSKGAGQDFISNYDVSMGKTDTLLLTGILSSEVNLSRTGNDLVMSINGTADKVTLSYYLQNDGINDYKVEQFKFDDGTTWDMAAVKAKLLTGTSNNDSLFGYASDDVLSGGAGADYLYGYGGNDILNGEDGNDIVYAGAGNDTLIGGAGNDTLMGDAGSDVFKFASPNQGVDSISDFISGVDSMHMIASNFGLSAGSNVKLLSNGTTPIASGTEVQFLYNTTSGALYFDRDGVDTTYNAVQIVTLTGQKTLAAADIVVVDL